MDELDGLWAKVYGGEKASEEPVGERAMSAKVFVSSTYNDLKHHRARVIEQLESAGLFVDPMEKWPADTQEPDVFSPERVVGCSLCILLVGFRRGWVPDPNGANRSITQMEYDEAVSRGIDVLPILLADDVSDWPDAHDERLSDPQVNAWRELLRPMSGNSRFHFRSDPKTVDVLAAVHRWRQRHEQRDRLQDYLSDVRNVHRNINFLGLPSFKECPDPGIDELFVEPGLSSALVDPGAMPWNAGSSSSLFSTIGSTPRLMVLGGPGTGKSTLINWIAYQLADNRPNQWKARLGNAIPLPLVLRDLGVTRRVTWASLLTNFLSIGAHNLLKADQLTRLMEDGLAFLLLDGLDEIGDMTVRRSLRTAVHQGIEMYGKCRWLLTSRSVGYDEVPFHIAREGQSTQGGHQSFNPRSVLHIRYVAPFDDAQIAAFARKWYDIREADKFRAERGAKDLVAAVRRDRATLSLARIPNLLTMMALVHRVRAFLPHGKALLYDDVAKAYLETIDEFRRLPTDADSLRDKKRWLGRIGFEMQVGRALKGKKQVGAIIASREALQSWLAGAMEESGKALDPDDPARFVDRVRRRSGLMIESGPDRFAFTHLSIQEYFAAVYLKERINTPGWLRGDIVTPGTAPDDLQGYSRQVLWQEVLVFLFELVADEAPDWKDALRDAVFGEGWKGITPGNNAHRSSNILLSRLATDPHVKWTDGTVAAAIRHCGSWAAADQQARLATRRHNSSTESTRVYRPHEGLEIVISEDGIEHLLTGEPRGVQARLEQVVQAFREARCQLLFLDDPYSEREPIAFPTILEGWTELLHVITSQITNSDLSAFARCPTLVTLILDAPNLLDISSLVHLDHLITIELIASDMVKDWSPIKSCKELRYLSIDCSGVDDWKPFSELMELRVMDLRGVVRAPLWGLSGIAGLKELILRTTSMRNLNGIDQLRRLRPDVSIYEDPF